MTARSERSAGIVDVSPLALIVPPAAITAGLWATSPNTTEPTALAYAFVLLLMPWGSVLVWRRGTREGLPVFAMIGATFWVYFGLALLWGSRELSLVTSAAAYIPNEELVTETMRLAVIGVFALWLGMRTPVTVWVPANLPDIVDHPRSWAYVQLVLLAGVGFRIYSGSAWLLGAGGRQAMVTLATVVPNVAFVLLLRRYLRGVSTQGDRLILSLTIGILVMGGLASGWLGSVALVAVMYGAVVLMERRRIPWVAVAATTFAILFLQVGKNEFRNAFWSEQREASMTDRARFWLDSSASRWHSAFRNEENESVQNLASESLRRASLLTQVAHVVDLTPSEVPFQEGATYQYLAVTFIPRFLWPDKPSVNEANRFYQVAYGMTSERGLESTSIAVGYMAEGFINFGWAGVVGVMFCVGLALGLYERTFGLTRSSSLFMAIGLALVPGFLSIESQLGQYFGGVIQQTALATLVFLPIARRRGVGVEATPPMRSSLARA